MGRNGAEGGYPSKELLQGGPERLMSGDPEEMGGRQTTIPLRQFFHRHATCNIPIQGGFYAG